MGEIVIAAAAETAKRRPRAKRERAAESDNPVEIAMVAASSGRPLPDAARNVLEKHALLIDCQAELAKAQTVEIRLRHVGERVRAAMWASLAILAFLLVALVISVVVKAARSDALIVQGFRVPPSLAATGLTGEVVATQVLDKLAELQENSESTRAASTYASNWEDELKIDIPNTGATTDQVWKLLRGWLGKETRITGEVIETGAGLALTARVGAMPGRRFVSETRSLDELVTRAAELIYRSSQPYRYAITLPITDPVKRKERLELLRELTADPSELERKWAYNGLAVVLREEGDFRGSLAMIDKALAIDPEMVPATGNQATIYQLLGQDQKYVETMKRQYALPLNEEYDRRIVEANNCLSRARLGSVTRSIADLTWSLECLERTGAFVNSTYYTQAQLALMRRDPQALAAVTYPDTNPLLKNLNAASYDLSRALLDRVPADLATSLARYRAALAAYSATAPTPYYRATLPTFGWPAEAEALSALGRHREAEALIARTPLDCYDCLRVRGHVARGIGNRAAAQSWYLKAAGQGPRLAPAFLDWGRLLLDSGRLQTAEVKLREAARLAPTWPDARKYYGDVLARQGKRREALAEYAAATRLAPKWTELQQARARLQRSPPPSPRA
ncbi:hypothetical protein [Sphingomonas mesophila]|uniref:hypothetical protein n=1 Tax=Sphingomonas mesophila TaxID=2303576 RepID=UPI0013C31DD9|nr:hypothetical protein [Sphingomonas mesophila]